MQPKRSLTEVSQSYIQAQTPKKSPKIRNVPGDPNPQYFSKSTAVQMGGVLPYKWEAYCSTNGRRIAGFPFLRSLEARKARQYKWGAYCRTNWRCTAVLFRQVVGVGVSETLPKKVFPGLLAQSVEKSLEKVEESLSQVPKIKTIFPPPTPKSADFTSWTWFRKKSPY